MRNRTVAFRTKARVGLARRDGHDDFNTCALIEVCRSPFDFPKDWLKCYLFSRHFRLAWMRAGPPRQNWRRGGQFKLSQKLRMRRFCAHVCAKTNPGDRTRGVGTRNRRYFNVQDLGTALADRQPHQPDAGRPMRWAYFLRETARPTTPRRKIEKLCAKSPVLPCHNAFAFLIYPM